MSAPNVIWAYNDGLCIEAWDAPPSGAKFLNFNAPELVALVDAAISVDNFMRGDKAYERSGYGPRLRAALAAWEALK